MTEAKRGSSIKEGLRSIDDYWFGRGSPTALGLFRIMVGILSAANVFLLGLHWEAWFSEKGYVPNWLNQRYASPNVALWYNNRFIFPKLGLLNGVTDPRITIPFFVLVGVFSITSALGLWTRFSTIAMAVGVISIQYRDMLILHGGDSVVRLWCIYLAVSPCGQACSLDRMIGLWRGKIKPGPVAVSLWSQRLVTYNIALIYFTTIWLKWDGDLWRHGLATYFPARLPEFFRFPYPHFINDLPFVRITTWGTLLTEFSMSTLVFFRPLRKYVLTGGILMHFWIEYSMNIPLFSFLMCSSYICFYDGDEIAAWAKRVGLRLKRWHATVSLPRGQQLKPSAAATLAAVDPFDLVDYRPSEIPEWTAQREDGSAIAAPRASWTRSVGAWPIGWIPGIWMRTLDRAVVDKTAEPQSAKVAARR